MRPLYLGTTPDPVLAFLHQPKGEPVSTAVLFCSPWGWDDVASYRARRSWAEQLAARGHPTLRFDFPGTGDSGGSAYDPARVGACSDAVTAASAWLRAETGCLRIAAIGLGIGGLFLAKSIAMGAAIDDLVLWGTPDRGRGFVRQERAFSQMQASRYSLTGEEEPFVLPDGWMESGGFVLSAETIVSLGAIDLATFDTGSLRRALLFDRDGIVIPPRVKTHLVEAGVEVTSGNGDGWGAMCLHPERYEVPEGVIGQVLRWIDVAPRAIIAVATNPVGTAPPPAGDVAELDVGGVHVRETALLLDLPNGRRFGVLAEPATTSPSDVTAIFLNAGAVRRIGPNRIWVEAARRWAARGVPTLRIDLAAIGDSDGDGTRYRDVGRFFDPELEGDIVAFIDELERRRPGGRVVLGGLCAGGYWSFHGAARDDRVIAALLLNPGLLSWDPEIISRRDARKLKRLRSPAWRRRVLRGEVRMPRMLAIARALGTRAALRVIRLPRAVLRRRHLKSTPDFEEKLARLRDRGTRVLIAFSDDEPLQLDLQSDGFFARLPEWPNVEVQPLPGRDHTLRPIVVQRAVHEMLDRELTRALERVPATHRERVD